MADIIDINANRLHWTEAVTCSACGHGWQAVAPVGVDVCECPRCRKMAGVRYSPRELRMIRALEEIATGEAPNETASTNWSICRLTARNALTVTGWPVGPAKP